MARWISSAATVESTPPLSAADDAAVADLRANPRRRLVDERRHRPVAGAAADVEREVPQDLEAAIGVRDLGMKQQAVQAARACPPSPRPARWRSSRRRESPAARPRRSRRGSPTRAARRAAPLNSARLRRRSRAPSRGRTRDAPPARRGRRACRSSAACRSRCRARACPARTAPGSHFGAPASDTLFGPPERMTPTGCARAQRLERRVERQNLAVDGQLAQAARDQLRELRAEIENENRLM